MSEENNGIEGVFGGDSAPEQAPQTQEPKAQDPKPAAKPAAKNTKPKPKPKPKTVKVKLAHNKDIPPSGLFIGHNGRGYLLKPGVEADVPEFLLDVLDNAVATKPVTDSSGRVQGYEEQPRFMYTIVRDKK